jgi:hypothetical protein
MLLRAEGYVSAIVKCSNEPMTAATPFGERIIKKLNKAAQDARMSAIKKAYGTFDHENLGRIDMRQFCSAMQQLNQDSGALEDEFKKISRGGQYLTFVQFAEFLIKEKQNKTKLNALLHDRAKAIFDQFISASAPQQVNDCCCPLRLLVLKR